MPVFGLVGTVLEYRLVMKFRHWGFLFNAGFVIGALYESPWRQHTPVSLGRRRVRLGVGRSTRWACRRRRLRSPIHSWTLVN